MTDITRERIEQLRSRHCVSNPEASSEYWRRACGSCNETFPCEEFQLLTLALEAEKLRAALAIRCKTWAALNQGATS